jgi:hypothetical protein
MSNETTSFVPVKESARKSLPIDNELHDAILTEPDAGSRMEIGMKHDAYSRMLDAKVRRMKRDPNEPIVGLRISEMKHLKMSFSGFNPFDAT